MNKAPITENALAQNFNAFSLLRFALPSIAMMIFMGLYTIVDTIFAARFVNEYALSAINIVCPVVNVTVGLGTMLASGGSAIISREMGRGMAQKAKEDFSLIIVAGIALGLMITLTGLSCRSALIYALGASDLLYPYCRDYLTILLLFLPANVLQTLFQNLFVAAGKPGLGFAVSIAAGAANIVFDYVFIVCAGMGIAGAALGTGIGYSLPAAVGLIYFSKNTGTLSFCRPKLDIKLLGECCYNGSSEMLGQLAGAVTTLLFNQIMISLAGESGVAAITIIIYSQFLLSTLYIGYSMGVAPVIGYHYGSQNTQQQKVIFRICIRFILITSLLTFLLCLSCSRFLSALFVDSNSDAYRLSVTGFSLFAYSFLFCGLNIFTSAMFTAFSNGVISAVLSLLRSFGLVTAGLLVLPKLCGLVGVWLAVPIAEGIVFLLSLLCLYQYRKRYGYL